MVKALAGAAVGVFVGAMAMEILHRAKPQLVEGLSAQVADTVKGIAGAFLEGYRAEEEEAEAPAG
ncbi:MAG: hypothetical protein Kow0092_37240 [Deferrisomatales bacterium]